jgi:hypothetical protein
MPGGGFFGGGWFELVEWVDTSCCCCIFVLQSALLPPDALPPRSDRSQISAARGPCFRPLTPLQPGQRPDHDDAQAQAARHQVPHAHLGDTIGWWRGLNRGGER